MQQTVKHKMRLLQHLRVLQPCYNVKSMKSYGTAK